MKILFPLGAAFLATLVWLLPRCVLMRLGKGLGTLAYHFAKRRAHIARVNIAKCFPELTKTEQEALVKKNCQSVGMGAIDITLAWWLPAWRFKHVPFELCGVENLKAARAGNTGVILCGSHFTCLEMIGRLLGAQHPFHIVYRKHESDAYEALLTKKRSRYAISNVDRNDIRAMVRVLKKGDILWYAPDQDFAKRSTVMAPFFGIQTATLTGTAWLAKVGKAKVVATFLNRTTSGGYAMHFLPAFDNFPSGDDIADATRYNAALEAHIKQYPDQYLWLHRRFKTRPEGEASFY
jgi:KDO2-lipid IV(A) lauroyltransferase